MIRSGPQLLLQYQDTVQHSCKSNLRRPSDVALVLSRIDYYNHLHLNFPDVLIRRHQTLVNAAARTIFGRSRFCHITDFVRDELH